MPAMRTVAAARSATFISALLMSTAFAVPAFAQIETVVVTAERKAEDIQTVPIAISAFSSADLAAHQIVQPKDLQFAMPSVTYTKTNFTGFNFQIRGIGTQVISGDAEGGVAFNSDDVYYASAGADASLYYDMERVEVLRGPQSTLYGRGATGGAVNSFSNKPHLDEFAASFDADYGTYGSTEDKAMVNIPIITDELAIRVAGDFTRHDGFITNINTSVTDHHPDGLDEWAGRALVRWQPSQNTTVDLIFNHSDENDTRMRGEKQLCHTDPTGVLGCLPDSTPAQPINLNATFLYIPVSKQATQQAFGASLGPLAGALGLFDLTQPFVALPGSTPAGARTVNSDFTPSTKSRGNSLSLEVKQNITDWLDFNAVGSYADGHLVNQESYTNSVAAPFNPVLLGTSEAVFAGTLASIGTAYGQPNYGNTATGPYAFVFAHPGMLPTSNTTNNGIIGGSINRYTGNPFAYDQSSGNTTQKSAEARFDTHFDGPLNGMIGIYYLNTKSIGDYFVASNTLDYGQTLFGGIGGAALYPNPMLSTAVRNLCVSPTNGRGCIYGSPFYDNEGKPVSLESKSVYGELYYDILPDLKFTGGLRYTEDLKKSSDRITIFAGPEPIGTTNEDAGLNQLVTNQLIDFDSTNGTPPYDNFENTRARFSKLTGRSVLTWTPKVDWSDQTMFYASYSKGYKAGGSNPGVQPGNVSVPAFYKPETIDAYEFGTKNTFMDGMFQANLSAWYYNYHNYQVSEILSNTSVNSNTNAFLNGIEGEFVWAPEDDLQFSLNMDWMETKVGKGTEIDPRNPTGGLPNALLIKDGTLSSTNAQNCVLYYSGSNFNADFNVLSALAQSPTSGPIFYAPPGGTAALQPYGVAHAAYGTCASATLAAFAPVLAATHFSTTGANSTQTLTGAAEQLDGRQLANSPPYSISFGAQYTAALGGGYNLVSRFDYYWQAHMYGRIFNDSADSLDGYGVGNLSFTLNSPDSNWYVQVFGRNIFNSNNTTGQYLTSSSSGLWTGAFYGDPRVIGAAVGARF